jgi:FixJ family two-component response regulator
MTDEEWDRLYDRHRDEVFRLSLNVQVRRGDPVRERDRDLLEATAAERGLTDEQIAERLDLDEETVRAIRIRAEREMARPQDRWLLYRIGRRRRRR